MDCVIFESVVVWCVELVCRLMNVNFSIIVVLELKLKSRV